MDYQGRIIRPPNEHDAILLQVTCGCSHNKCTFCAAYKDKRFSIKPPKTVQQDIAYAREHFTDARRLFLCDGDALIMPQKRLESLIADIRRELPWIRRIGSYANAKALAIKTDDELLRLRELGLGAIYMGLESGHDKTLARVKKHGDSAFIIKQGRRAREAGFKLSVTVLLGLGGVEHSLEHARATGLALSEMDPHQVGALTLMVVPGTELFDEMEAGAFALPDAHGMLRELHAMLEATNLSRGLFMANHASNYLPMKLRLPKDKSAGLAAIEAALAGETSLKPEEYRRL